MERLRNRLPALTEFNLKVPTWPSISAIFSMNLICQKIKQWRVWIKLCSTDRSQSLAEPSPRVSLVQSGSFSKKTEDICKPDADSHSIFFTYYSYEQQSS
jgi:hypothetical protein